MLLARAHARRSAAAMMTAIAAQAAGSVGVARLAWYEPCGVMCCAKRAAPRLCDRCDAPRQCKHFGAGDHIEAATGKHTMPPADRSAEELFVSARLRDALLQLPPGIFQSPPGSSESEPVLVVHGSPDAAPFRPPRVAPPPLALPSARAPCRLPSKSCACRQASFNSIPTSFHLCRRFIRAQPKSLTHASPLQS